VLVDKAERVLVAVAVGRDRCFKHDSAGDDFDDRERMRIAMWVDADDVIQLICKHPNLTSSRALGDTTVSVWGGNRRRQNCDGSRAHNADRLLIRPASGRQADTGPSTRTNHWKDTATAGHSRIESQTESTGANLTTAPDGTAHTLTVPE